MLAVRLMAQRPGSQRHVSSSHDPILLARMTRMAPVREETPQELLSLLNPLFHTADKEHDFVKVYAICLLVTLQVPVDGSLDRLQLISPLMPDLLNE